MFGPYLEVGSATTTRRLPSIPREKIIQVRNADRVSLKLALIYAENRQAAYEMESIVYINCSLGKRAPLETLLVSFTFY